MNHWQLLCWDYYCYVDRLKDLHELSSGDAENEELHHTACTIEAEIERIR